MLRWTELVWSKRKPRPVSSTIGGAYQRSGALSGYVRTPALAGPPRLMPQRGCRCDLMHQLAPGPAANRPAARSVIGQGTLPRAFDQSTGETEGVDFLPEALLIEVVAAGASAASQILRSYIDDHHSRSGRNGAACWAVASVSNR